MAHGLAANDGSAPQADLQTGANGHHHHEQEYESKQ
jgi:hypothetical protein